jgi:hypothetical protein
MANASATADVVKPQVGIDDAGNAIVVFKSSGNIMTSRRAAAGGWSAPAFLESGTDGADNPQIAVNGSGQAVAAWQQSQNVYVQHYAPETTYSVTVNLNPAAGGTASCTPTSGIPSGGSTQCTATANSGYTFTSWTTSWGSTSGTCASATCTIPNITGDATITANFAVAPAAVNGACGSAATPQTSAPTTNLCSVGTPSAVSGTGPWTWTCAGSNGGTTASCTAPLAPPGSIAITALVSPPAAGTITCSPNPVASGGTSVCTAVANPGYTWMNFTYGPHATICASNPCTIPNIPSPITVTANMAAAPFVAATTQPIPTLSEWGLLILSLLTLGTAGKALRQRG